MHTQTEERVPSRNTDSPEVSFMMKLPRVFSAVTLGRPDTSERKIVRDQESDSYSFSIQQNERADFMS